MDHADPDAPTAADRPTGWSHWFITTLVACALAVVLVVALAAAGIDALREDRPRALEGQVFDLPESGGRSDFGTVFLPWTKLAVAVGDPRDELPTSGSEEADTAPPDGGSFVQVEVDERDEDADIPLIGPGDSPDVDARVVLVADDVEYPLDGPEGLDLDPALKFERSLWVAVPGEPTEVAVKFTVDGQEQTVESGGSATQGRAEALADLPSSDEMINANRTGCGKARRADDSSLRFTGLSTCEISAGVRTPYVDGLGWAPEGREYLAVVIDHDLASKQKGEHDEWAMRVRVDGRLGDRRPQAVRRSASYGNAHMHGVAQWKPHLVFDVPAGGPTDDLTVRMDVRSVASEAFAEDETARLEWTIPRSDLP